jgi:ATP-binding cassette, subfamily B, multidrug efflux pump
MTASMTPSASHFQRAKALLISAAESEKPILRAGVIWLVLAALLESAGPLLGKHFLDTYLLPRNADFTGIVITLLAMWLVGISASLLRYSQLVRLAGVAMRSVQRLRERVFSHVLALPMRFFDSAITGQLVSRVTNDTEQVKQLYVQVLFVMLDSTIVVCGAFIAMAWLDWRLMLIVSLLVPAVVLIVRVYQRWSAPAVIRARQLRSDINAQIAESIAGMPVIQASNAQARFTERFTDTNTAHYEARRDELKANAWLLRPMLDLLNVALLAIVIYGFGARVTSSIEIGVLYAFITYLGRVIDPLIQITLQFSQLQQSIVAAARVDDLLREPTDATQAQQSNSHEIRHGAIRLHEVSFAYKANAPILHGLSLDIPAGAFYGIVGHTGSGKSTLLSLLLRFYAANSGHIEIDGVPLADFDPTAFRRHVGLVPQEPFLLAASVAENIAMGRNLSRAQIAQAAQAAQCAGFISTLAQGYDTVLGEGGARLSTGQKQLIAIARALAGKPRILFLDEATSNIDSETEQLVQHALTALRGRVTIVAIAHRLSTIRDADSIVVLSHGHIAEQGAHGTLLERENGLYQKLYWLQQIDATSQITA